MADFTFEEQANHEKRFALFHQQKIAPILESLEAQRLALKEKARKRAVIVGTITLVLALLALNVHPFFPIFPLLFGSAFTFVTYDTMGDKFRTSLTEKIAPLLCKFLGQTQYQRHPEPDFLPIDQLQQLSLLPNNGRYTLKEAVHGTWRDVSFRLLDAHFFTTERDYNDKQRRTTIFSGIVIEVDCPVHMPIIVFLPDFGNLMNRVFKWAGRNALPAHKLAFPDSDLESIYEVYTDDVEQAQKLLKPEFGNKLLRFSKQFQGRNRTLRAAFKGQKFYMAISLPHDFLNLNAYHDSLENFDGRLRAALSDLTIPRKIIDQLID